MSSSVSTKDPRGPSWSCSLWRAVGGCIASLCEEVPLEDNPGLRLQLLLEERQRQLEVHRAQKDADLSQAAEQPPVALRAEEPVKDSDSESWKHAEEKILQRRENMTSEERLQDCLWYFDSLRPASTQEDGESPMRLPSKVVLVAESDNSIAEDAPHGCVEEWLYLHFGTEADVQFRRRFSSAALGKSGGSLCDNFLLEIVVSFVSVLRTSVKTLSYDIDAIEKKGTGVFQNLDRLLAELEEPGAQEPEPRDLGDLRSLKAVRARHEAVAAETSRLLAVVEEDPAACCVLLALAMLAASDAEFPPDFKRVQPFQAPTFMLSTADVCCALCSEKRSFLVQEFLFSPLSNPAWPRWSDWGLLRRTGVAWWAYGEESTEMQDFLVRRMTQASRERLRDRKRAHGVDGLLLQAQSKELLQLVDETVFWCVVSGLTLAQLRALLRTAELTGEAALRTLLEHPQVNDAAFLRRNASRLQQVHRYHFAAALLLLAGSLDDASLLLAYHLQDTQLMLLALRRHPEAIARRLRDVLEDVHRGATLVRRDPWLHLLVAAHLGDSEEVQRALREQDHGMDFEVFEGALRLSQDAEGMAEVVRRLDRARV